VAAGCEGAARLWRSFCLLCARGAPAGGLVPRQVWCNVWEWSSGRTRSALGLGHLAGRERSKPDAWIVYHSTDGAACTERHFRVTMKAGLFACELLQRLGRLSKGAFCFDSLCVQELCLARGSE